MIFQKMVAVDLATTKTIQRSVRRILLSDRRNKPGKNKHQV
jgi:hypothetical protein